MRKYVIVTIIAFIVLFLLLARFSPKASATTSHTTWGEWTDTSVCKPIECGSADGLKSQERVCVKGGEGHECSLGSFTAAHYEYANPICPTWYHPQNSGNWNQRCHRDFNWMQPEHKAPTGCPTGYTQNEAVCQKWVEEVNIPADKQTQEIKCEAEIVACEPTVNPTPTPPEMTPTPTPEQPAPQPCNGCGQKPEAFVCTNQRTFIPPINFFVERASGSATLKWVPTQGDQANIYYKNPSAKDWEHSVRDIPNNGHYVIGSLGSHDWSFGLQQKFGCGGGDIISVVIDDNSPRIFTFSYYQR